MRSTLLLVLLYLMGLPLAHGQVFEKGYLILHRTDTLRCEIENGFWQEPPASVRIRMSENEPVVRYSTRHLRGVGLASGRTLVWEWLPIDRTAEVRVDFLPPSPIPHPLPDSVLADVLATGPVRMLGVQANGNRHYFLQRSGEAWLELAGRNYLKSDQGDKRMVDANNYRGQLRLYFSDRPDLHSLIETLPYTTDALVGLVNAYNHGRPGAVVPAEPAISTIPAMPKQDDSRPSTSLQAGVLLGLRYNSMRVVSSQEAGTLDETELDGRPHVQGGGYLDLLLPGRRVALHTSLQGSLVGRPGAVPFTGTYAGPVPNPFHPVRPGSYEWHAALLTLQAGVRYVVPRPGHKSVFFGTGFEMNTFWLMTSELRFDGRSDNFVSRFYGGYPPYAELGLNYKHLSASLNARIYASDYYRTRLLGDGYHYLPWSLSLTIGYRLTADTDLVGVSFR